MRKIISLFAFVAIVISFAACSGNDGNVPEVKGFTFKAQALSTKSYYEITAKDPNAYFYWDGCMYTEGSENTLKEYTEDVLNEYSFQYLVNTHNISNVGADHTSSDREPDTKYIVWACYVEEDPVTKKGKIISNIEYVIFTTMPAYTLNGEFTVDENGKKVRFMQANMQQASSFSGLSLMENQWDYKGTKTGYPRDLFTWDQAAKALPSTAPYHLLPANEWAYLFRERPNAEKLFAHATVNDINGLILLPDNWHTPDDINLTTDFDMGFRWDESEEKYVKKDFDGFAGNTFNKDKWATLEFAGAVFLPAPRSLEGVPNALGYYWSSTIDENSNNFVHAFNFKKDEVDVSTLMSHPIYKPTSYLSIRPVREIK